MDSTRKIEKVSLRNLHMEDYDQLAKSFKRIYADSDVFWTRSQIKKLITIFPEGQVVIIVDDKIVGCALSIIVNYNMVKGDHTYAQVTGNETFNTHDANGNILYGIEVFIHPDYRGLRLARRMYEYRKELCEKLNLKAIMFGGRIPNYHKYADQMRPKEYIEKVRSREIYDPVLTFQLSNDFHVRRVIRNYLPSDEESEHCATLLQWDNIYYQPPTDSYVDRKPTVRIGLVQWQMRPYASVDDLFEQVEFFVDSVSDYKSDFILFPEYFNAPLMAKFNDMGEAQSIRAMAQYTDQIRSFGQVDVAHRVQSGAEHRDTCDELAERQCLLCGDPSVGHDADQGWHKYGDESLCGEEKPDLGTKPGLAEKTSHRCQVRSPDGVLEEVHNDQPEADVLVAHNVIVFFVIMRMVKTNKCTSFRLKITIFEGKIWMNGF